MSELAASRPHHWRRVILSRISTAAPNRHGRSRISDIARVLAHQRPRPLTDRAVTGPRPAGGAGGSWSAG